MTPPPKLASNGIDAGPKAGKGMARRLAWLACAGTAALACAPAWAATYTFPGALPAACSSTGAGTYSCTALTLGSNDTVNVVGTATVAVLGNLDIKGSQVNASGSAASMTREKMPRQAPR